jgi:dihydrofolate synthase/folylpolyglutamate synthase
MILEVGMGGRRDATNIIDSDLAIITTVALDHQAYLGLTRAAIGYQKAGILRAHKPFIYADDDPPSSVVNEGIRLKAPMLQSSLQFEINDGLFQFSQISGEMLEFPVPKLHPKAVAAALMASAELQILLPVAKNAKIAAMETVALMGRQHFEIHQGVPTLLDVAHNEQAVGCLSEKIQAWEPRGKVRAVFSALKDKDLCGLIRGLSSLVDVWYLAELEGKRSSSESMLQEAFYEVLNIRPPCFKDPKQAYAQALKDAQMGDLVVVYGSFLTVGSVLSQIYRP